MHALVTGAGGFLGRYIVEQLVARGDRVRTLSRGKYAELDRLGVSYWTTKGVTGPEAEQVFVLDPFGNIIELHQEGTCRCNSRTVAGAGARMS